MGDGTAERPGGKQTAVKQNAVRPPVTKRANSDHRVGEPELRQLLAGLTAVRDGDFGTKLPDDADGLLGEIATVFNGMVDQLSLFTSEVTRVAREVGTEGRLGGQAHVPGVSGTWKDLTDSVNAMAGNLTDQVRDIAQVATAVAKGDLTQKITVDARGEILELKSTSTPWWTSCPRSPTRSPAWPARWAPRAGWAARPRCPASPAPGATSPTR